ncbi:MAG: hypothetical protein ACD_68C00009G0002 [uncultured bacterium]|nr:MAG: hypothetical protein ACD_68C00009G0002 [uncultured bacterium]
MESEKQNPKTLSLNGSWKYQAGNAGDECVSTVYDDQDWPTMDIPQNWHWQRIDAERVWFRKKFAINEQDCRNRRVILHFQGVDYFAEVWLNGEKLGRHEGYFQPFEFEITKQLKKVGQNTLVVKVDCPKEKGGKNWVNHKRLIKGILTNHDCRPGGFTQDGQSQNSGGIWKNVYLAFERDLSIQSVHITPYLTKDQEGLLKVNLRILNRVQDSLFTKFNITVSPNNFAGETQSFSSEKLIASGRNRFTFPYQIKEPRIWQTWDSGKPNLYRLEISLEHNGEQLDKQTIIFGFRDIKIDEQKNFILNNEKIFIRGVNYLGSCWPSETTPDRYTQDIELAKKGNCNLIRVHAHLETEEFYQLCDEAGILVWQDFPLQWGYQDDSAFIAEAQKQLKEMIALLYNHPSIILWCCHNEAPWANWWQTLVRHRIWINPWQNRELDRKLWQIARASDSTRPAIKNSGSFDEHIYLGWSYGDYHAFRQIPGFPLVSEFGAQSLPRQELLEKMFLANELDYRSEVGRKAWSFHNWQAKEMLQIAGVKTGKNLAEFVKNSQQYQANLLQFAIESYRRAKREGMSGCIQFMLIDSWSSISWSIIDCERVPKKGYYALQTAYQPIFPSIEYEQEEFLSKEQFSANLWVINDTNKAYSDTELEWKITKGESGEPLISGATTAPLEKNDVKSVVTLENLKDLNKGSYTLQVNIRSREQGMLGTNKFQFTIKE